MHKLALLQLAALFVITQILGLAVANVLIKEDIRTTIITENPEDIENAIGLFVYILVMTAFLLIIITFVKFRGVTFLFESLALFATSVIVFGALIPEAAGILTVLLIGLRFLLRESIVIKNIACLVAVAGAGSLIGVSLGVVPVAIFLILLAIYDYIAVFKTKHMVKIAKAITKENVAFAFSIPTREKVYQLGTGDLVMPLVFVTAVLNKVKVSAGLQIALLPIAVILLASLLGLLATLYYCMRKKVAMPALPLQTAFMLFAWVVFVLIGMPVSLHWNAFSLHSKKPAGMFPGDPYLSQKLLLLSFFRKILCLAQAILFSFWEIMKKVSLRIFVLLRFLPAAPIHTQNCALLILGLRKELHANHALKQALCTFQHLAFLRLQTTCKAEQH